MRADAAASCLSANIKNVFLFLDSYVYMRDFEVFFLQWELGQSPWMAVSEPAEAGVSSGATWNTAVLCV